MPLSAHEQAISQMDPVSKGPYIGLLQESVAMDILAPRRVSSFNITGLRFDEVDEPQFIPYNGTIPESTVKGKTISWGVYKVAEHADIDNSFTRDSNNIEDPAARQMRMKVRGLAYMWNNRWINGDRAADPNGPDGLEVIVNKLGSRQRVQPSSQIDISTGGADDDTRYAFLELIDEAHANVEGNRPTAAFANRQFLLRMKGVIRRLKLMGDNFNFVDNPVDTLNVRSDQRTAADGPAFVYEGVPYYDIGVRGDQTTQVIPNNITGVSTGETRVYYCAFGPDDVEGIEVTPMTTELVTPRLEGKDAARWSILHEAGWAAWGPRSVVRLGGIKVAP